MQASKNKMSLSPEKEKLYLNQKIRKRSTKQSSLCMSCTLLKRQVVQLRQLQQKLSKEIRLITALIPRQINNIILKLKAMTKMSSDEPPKINIKPPNNIHRKYSDHRDSIQSKSAYQSKLREEDGIIKQSIYKELKALRALQSKQKDLRIMNQKHQSLRKSISKESINSNHIPIPKMRKLQSSPKLSQMSHRNPIVQGMILRSQNNFQTQWINSPKFGNINEEEKFQAKIRFSSQQMKSKKKPQAEAKTELEQIKCQNGHECYKGETLNHLPHGNGTLVNCCSKIPFKVNPKTLKYTGSFRLGQFEGKGILICKDNVKFQGSFSKGMRHGEGTIYLEGASQKGFWQQDRLVSYK